MSTDMASAAAALYGSPTPSPMPAAPSAPTPASTASRTASQAPAPAVAAAPTANTQPAAPDAGNYDPDAKFMTQEEWDAAQAEAAAAATPVTVEQVQEAVAANIPDAIREQRDADEARKLYSPQVTFKNLINFELPGMEPEASKAVVAELREVVADIGFDAKDIPDLARAMRAQAPTTPEQKAKAWDEMATLMNSTFGDQAAQAYQDARAFVAADPRRAHLLAPAGFDPKVIVRVAQLARAAKAAGRI